MQAVGALAGGVAHEFNNLLAALLGSADIAAEQLAPGSPVAEDIENIRRTAQSAKALTRQLLVFSRKDGGRPVLLDLNDLVEQMEKMLRRIVGNQILVVIRLSNSLGQVRADAGQIEQVIMSLVVNARDAMPEGGTLTIGTDAVELGESFVRSHPGLMAGPFVRLSISDTGIGMSADVQAQLFTPFFTTKGPQGTGLGLATVHGIVHQADGCVAVESAPGHGTTVTVYLPRVTAPVEHVVAADPPIVVSPAPQTILFVEEDEGVRSLGARVLRQYGYAVLSARHAEEAIALSRQFSGTIDLLVTDVVMPGIDGRALFDQLRRSREDLKVLFTSATLLQKPYWPEKLAAAIRDILGGGI
jgi:CheY-like chemotaxis protein